MHDRILEAQNAVAAARNKALVALNAALLDGDANDAARHLTCLEFQLRAAEFTAAEAANAGLVLKVTRQHSGLLKVEPSHGS